MTYSVCEHHANPHGNTTRNFFSLLLGLPLFLTLGTFVHLGIGVAASAAEPELIERLPGAIDEHKVVMLDGAHAIAAWERDDGDAHETVWTSRRSASGNWTVPEIVEFAQGHASAVQLAVDAMGSATVLWIQQELNQDGLWSNRYIPDAGWQEPVRVEPLAGELYAPRLTISANARGFAVWERRQGGRFGIRASPYAPDKGWQAVRDIDTGIGNAAAPDVAMLASGAATAVWSLRNGGGDRRIVATRFTPGVGWDTAQVISVKDADAYDARVAMDGAGNAIATWEQKMHGEESVFANRFDKNKGWGTPVQLELDGEEAYTPKLAMSTNGNAVVAWIRAEADAAVIAAASYTPDRGWHRPHVVQGGNLLYIFDLDLAADANGRVLATWIQTDGSRNNVWYARFDAKTKWDAAALAEHRTGSAHQPRAVASPDGTFGVMWKTVDSPLPEQALYSLWFRVLP